MFTRFRTVSSIHVFDAPLIKIPPDVPGAMFLGALGGAYDYENEHLRSRLLQLAHDLKTTLEQTEFASRPDVGTFLVALRSVIEFLESVSENSVLLYSYDRSPSIDDLLDGFAEGGGPADWALEELGKQGDKGRKALLSILGKEQSKDRLLAAVSMLLLLFRDDRTSAAIESFIETGDDDVGKNAAILLAAYNTAGRQTKQ